MRVSILALGIVTAGSLAGCSDRSEPDPEPVSLKVLVPYAGLAEKVFGEKFREKYPDISIEAVTTEDEKPDVLFFQVMDESMKNKLINLEPYISQSAAIHLEAMNPHILEALREQGDGSLYALTPSFHSYGLFYNKEIFDQYNVPYPSDSMTWNDVLELAARFNDPNKQPEMKGFYFDGPAWNLAHRIGRTNGLVYLDDEEQNVLIASEGWTRIIQGLVEGYKQGYMQYKEDAVSFGGSYEERDLFREGGAAMTYNYAQYANFLEYDNTRIGKTTFFSWDVAAPPVGDIQSGQYSADGIISRMMAGIHSESAHVEEAWKLIEYVAGEEFGKLQTNPFFEGEVPVYMEHAQKYAYNMQAFYKARPMHWLPASVAGFESAFGDMARNTLNQLMDGQGTAEELLNRLQNNAQIELNALRNKQ